MAYTRPSLKPGEQSSRNVESAALKKFLHKLEDAQSNADVKLLLSDCPEPNAPGRRFYSNLAFFIEHLVPPRSAGISETMLYVKLAERLRSRGEADNDARAQMVAAFKSANTSRR